MNELGIIRQPPETPRGAEGAEVFHPHRQEHFTSCVRIRFCLGDGARVNVQRRPLFA